MRNLTYDEMILTKRFWKAYYFFFVHWEICSAIRKIRYYNADKNELIKAMIYRKNIINKIENYL